MSPPLLKAPHPPEDVRQYRSGMRRKLAVLALTLCLQGCLATVAPWERGKLAREDMSLTPAPDRAWMQQHVYSSKEAATGGHGPGGGGCGCN